MTDIVQQLQERADSYRLGGPSSEHTAILLERAAIEIRSLREELKRSSTSTIDKPKGDA